MSGDELVYFNVSPHGNSLTSNRVYMKDVGHNSVCSKSYRTEELICIFFRVSDNSINVLTHISIEKSIFVLCVMLWAVPMLLRAQG